jgi:hypothetical protein
MINELEEQKMEYLERLAIALEDINEKLSALEGINESLNILNDINSSLISLDAKIRKQPLL